MLSLAGPVNRSALQKAVPEQRVVMSKLQCQFNKVKVVTKRCMYSAAPRKVCQ